MTHYVFKNRNSIDDIRSRKKDDPRMIHHGNGTASFRSRPLDIYDITHSGSKTECDAVKFHDKAKSLPA